MDEKWTDVIGFEGRYQVSDHGRVKSLEHTITTYKQERITLPEIIMSTPLNKNGYRVVHLQGCTFNVHRLVAEAFLPNNIRGTCVIHVDGDRTNNHVENLRWCTRQQASRHRKG